MRSGRFSVQSATRWFLAAAAGMALLAMTTPHATASSTPMLVVTGYPTPGNTLTLEGTRLIVGGTATIYDNSTVIGTVPVKQMLSIVGLDVGGFRTTYTIPFNTTIGSHTLKAVEQPSGLIVQTSITVAASWAQYGFSPTNTRYNPYETSISPANVSTLTLAWSYASNFQFDTPVVVNGNIYFTNTNETIFARNAVTGASVWAYNTFYPVGSDAPAVYNGTLYAAGYYLYAVDTASDKQTWMSNGYMDNWPTTYANGMVYTDLGGELEAFDAKGCLSVTCDPIWTTLSLLNSGIPIYGGPAVVGNTIYAGGKSELLVANATTGAISWSGVYGTGGGYTGSPVVDGGYVFIAAAPSIYFSTSTLYAFNASGCGQATCSPLWTASIQEGDGYAAGTGLAVANNTVFVNGYGLYAFPEGGCGAATCSPSWIGATTSPGQGNWMIDSAPAVANGLVYAGVGDNTVRAFDANGCRAATCQPVWNYCTTGATCSPSVAGHFGSPVVINGMVYIATYGGTLYAFKLSGATAREASGVNSVSASPAHATRNVWARPSIVPPDWNPLML